MEWDILFKKLLDIKVIKILYIYLVIPTFYIIWHCSYTIIQCYIQGDAKKVTMITAVAKKKDDPTKQKGELMESNMDAMEVCVQIYTCWEKIT